MQLARSTQLAQRDLDILPRRILGEIRADYNFEAIAGGPPVLSSPGAVKCEVVRSDLFVGGRHVCSFSVWRVLLDSFN
jgi:hypothetical protein